MPGGAASSGPQNPRKLRRLHHPVLGGDLPRTTPLKVELHGKQPQWTPKEHCGMLVENAPWELRRCIAFGCKWPAPKRNRVGCCLVLTSSAIRWPWWVLFGALDP